MQLDLLIRSLPLTMSGLLTGSGLPVLHGPFAASGLPVLYGPFAGSGLPVVRGPLARCLPGLWCGLPGRGLVRVPRQRPRRRWARRRVRGCRGSLAVPWHMRLPRSLGRRPGRRGLGLRAPSLRSLSLRALS